jgi:SprT protein
VLSCIGFMAFSAIILPMIEPIGKHQQTLVIQRSEEYLSLATELFATDFPTVDFRFDLPGGCAGMFKISQGQCLIRYNPWLFAKYFDDNLNETVPHEVAHYVVHQLYPRRRVRPHGEEWRSVMHGFGVEPRVTGSYDLSGIPQRRQKQFDYACKCQVHQLGSRRHSTVQRGRGQYLCLRCNKQLDYLGRESAGG